MAKIPRKMPGTSEVNDPRAQEYFFQQMRDLLKLVGSVTIDLGSIAAGTKTTFTVPVAGVRPDKGQMVLIGPPSTIDQNLIFWGVVTLADVVTVIVYNPTAGAIDPPSATYWVRVMP